MKSGFSSVVLAKYTLNYRQTASSVVESNESNLTSLPTKIFSGAKVTAPFLLSNIMGE